MLHVYCKQITIWMEDLNAQEVRVHTVYLHDKRCYKQMMFEGPKYWQDKGYTFSSISWLQGYRTYFKLNSTEHEIYHAHKCLNANNYWHLTFISMINTTSERLVARYIFICRN